MRKTGLIAGFVLAFSLLVIPLEAQGEQPIVRAYLFYSETCPSCLTVRRDVVPELYRQFGPQLRIKAIEITLSAENYRWKLACEEAYGVPQEESVVPILFIGDTYLVGTDIQDRLSALVQEHLDNGGVAYPDVPPPDSVPEPAARFMLFYSPTCPHCKDVEDNVLPKIRAKYGDRVQWDAYDVSQEANLRALIELGRWAGLPEDQRGSVPAVFAGDDYSMYLLLRGSMQIAETLDPALDWFLDVGGVAPPAWASELFESAESPPVQPTPELPSQGAEIHVAYFVEAGCSECSRVSNLLKVIQKQFPYLVVHEFNIVDSDDIKLNLCLSEALDVPEGQRHDAPAIFVGVDYLVDRDIQLDPLIEILSQYTGTGAEPIWEACTDKVEIPPPAPWWAVILPGLIDGINPCAFATIVFFISYLSLTERKGRDIIIVGISFTLAIFISYLGFGIALREILAGLIDQVGSILKLILNALTAVVCLVLGGLSLADYRKARRGRTRHMTLRLPDKLRRWINATVRKGMQSETLGRLVIASFVTGVVVSFIELTCTGQVYAPIILGLSNPQYRVQAISSLIVYCLAFIVPLIVVFIVSYMGTNSRQLGLLLKRHTANVKLITAILFLGIGVWLIYDMLRIWGIAAFVTA